MPNVISRTLERAAQQRAAEGAVPLDTILDLVSSGYILGALDQDLDEIDKKGEFSSDAA